MNFKKLYFILLILTSQVGFSQTATIKGMIRNSEKEPIEGVSVSIDSLNGTTTNTKGEYELTVPAKQKITILYNHTAYKSLSKNVKIPKNKTFRYSPILEASIEETQETIVINRTSQKLDFSQTATIKGKVRDAEKEPIKGVSISIDSLHGTTTNTKGEYELTVPAKQQITVVYSHITYNTLYKNVTISKNRTIKYSPTLEVLTEEIDEVLIKNNKKEVQGITSISLKKVKTIPSATPSVENLLMTLPGVNNNNELSTQYNVRGGNFDENLVYVNGIEVYRPFLVRSGQQEGLSFINPDMTRNIDFSAGGFQAKYGDKLSSVLDITYKKPVEKSTKINASLLGASATFEGQFLKNKLSTITGIRYRDNSLLVDSRDTETNYRPIFADLQTYLSYKVSDKLSVNFLGNISLNHYNYTPITRTTRFGTITNPIELTVFYTGKENDRFSTLFGAFSADYKPSEDLKLTLTTSAYNTQEEEFYDIIGAYSLTETIANEGDANFSEGIGGQISHARNELDALIQNIQLKITTTEDDVRYELGFKLQNENIKERINEWQVIDSAGFSVRPPIDPIRNNEPYTPYTGPITPYQSINATNDVDITRFSGFLQWSKRTEWKNHDIWYNLGIRTHTWTVSNGSSVSEPQSTFSPRGQFTIKPDWDKDMLFRVSGGYYSQPPSYRELKNYEGEINTNVKAQKSIHFVVGNDYSFIMWGRPFKLTSEAYVKKLSDVNAYTVDNVRIRYRADNVTEAYAAGFDIRLNGEFVPGNESWISLGVLQTEENIDNQGYIARPTDQRFKLGILFQDYIPSIPDFKVYLNLVYNSGLPGGAPSYSDPYDYQNRLPAYKRADVGFSYVIIGDKKTFESGWKSKFKELNVGLEVFNVFDITNTNTNTWVQDVYSKQSYAVPNYMTGRIFNVKLEMKF